MAEIGGSHTDDSAVNLGSTRDCPGTSNEPLKEGALKRPAEVEKDISVKKRRSAEEQASTSKGRNVTMKQKLKREKEIKKAEKIKETNQMKMMEARENLIDRIKKLEDRPMEMTDRAEEKALAREEHLRKALIDIEKNLAKNGLITDEETDEATPKSLSINIVKWPCLDTHVQDFALERIYDVKKKEKGVSMTTEDLLGIINKVRSLDPTIKFPTDESELDRLLLDVNYNIREAVKDYRFTHLMDNLIVYPGIDPNWEPDQQLKVKIEEDAKEDENLNLNKLAGRVIAGCGAADEDVECINLDDEDEKDRDKEADEDELSEKLDEAEEEEEEAKEDEDIVLLRELNMVVGKVGMKIKEEKVDTPMELSEENPIEKISNEQEPMIEKASDRPDSRGEKELDEGGTSTNSPTLDRDERLKELEKIEDIKDAAIVMPKLTEKGDNNGDMDANPKVEKEMGVLEVADTIVLTDDEDSKEVQKIPKSEVIEVKDDDIISPPKPPPMTHEEASRSKMREIQLWIDKGVTVTGDQPPEVLNLDSDEEKDAEADAVVVDDEDDDDDIKCIHDDFDWDSVSHSGLTLRQQQINEEQAAQVAHEAEVVEVIELE